MMSQPEPVAEYELILDSVPDAANGQPPADSPISFEIPPPDATPASRVTEAERRANPRKVMRVRAIIHIDEEERVPVDTADLSSNGIAVTSPRPLNVDQECSVELCVSVPELAKPPLLRASVRYCANLGKGQFRIGMRFAGISIEAAELLVATLGV